MRHAEAHDGHCMASTTEQVIAGCLAPYTLIFTSIYVYFD